jgi:hypothetical protein
MGAARCRAVRGRCQALLCGRVPSGGPCSCGVQGTRRPGRCLHMPAALATGSVTLEHNGRPASKGPGVHTTWISSLVVDNLTFCATRDNDGEKSWWNKTLDIVCTVYWTFLRNSVANNCFRYFLECGRSEFCSDLGSCCCESTESHMRTRFIFVPFYFTILQNIWYLQSFEMTVGSAIVSKHYLIW